MHLSSSLVTGLLLSISTAVTYISAITVTVSYCDPEQSSMINIDPGSCGQQMAYQNVCGIMPQGPTVICNLYTDLECQSQPMFSGHDFSKQNKGKVGSIKCTQ